RNPVGFQAATVIGSVCSRCARVSSNNRLDSRLSLKCTCSEHWASKVHPEDVERMEVRARLRLRSMPKTKKGMCTMSWDRIGLLAQVQEHRGGIEDVITAVIG